MNKKSKKNGDAPEICDRAIILGEYIIENNSTVRACAEHFSKQYGISKSTVHKDDGVIIGTVKGNAKKH